MNINFKVIRSGVAGRVSVDAGSKTLLESTSTSLDVYGFDNELIMSLLESGTNVRLSSSRRYLAIIDQSGQLTIKEGNTCVYTRLGVCSVEWIDDAMILLHEGAAENVEISLMDANVNLITQKTFPNTHWYSLHHNIGPHSLLLLQSRESLSCWNITSRAWLFKERGLGIPSAGHLVPFYEQEAGAILFALLTEDTLAVILQIFRVSGLGRLESACLLDTGLAYNQDGGCAMAWLTEHNLLMIAVGGTGCIVDPEELSSLLMLFPMPSMDIVSLEDEYFLGKQRLYHICITYDPAVTPEQVRFLVKRGRAGCIAAASFACTNAIVLLENLRLGNEGAIQVSDDICALQRVEEQIILDLNRLPSPDFTATLKKVYEKYGWSFELNFV